MRRRRVKEPGPPREKTRRLPIRRESRVVNMPSGGGWKLVWGGLTPFLISLPQGCGEGNEEVVKSFETGAMALGPGLKRKEEE